MTADKVLADIDAALQASETERMQVNLDLLFPPGRWTSSAEDLDGDGGFWSGQRWSPDPDPHEGSPEWNTWRRTAREMLNDPTAAEWAQMYHETAYIGARAAQATAELRLADGEARWAQYLAARRREPVRLTTTWDGVEAPRTWAGMLAGGHWGPFGSRTWWTPTPGDLETARARRGLLYQALQQIQPPRTVVVEWRRTGGVVLQSYLTRSDLMMNFPDQAPPYQVFVDGLLVQDVPAAPPPPGPSPYELLQQIRVTPANPELAQIFEARLGPEDAERAARMLQQVLPQWGEDAAEALAAVVQAHSQDTNQASDEPPLTPRERALRHHRTRSTGPAVGRYRLDGTRRHG